MCERFEEWKSDIEQYCNENGLNFEEAKGMAKGWNQDMLVLQYYDPNRKTDGLLDETPMPAVLWAFRGENEPRFEQTEHTKRYLAEK